MGAGVALLRRATLRETEGIAGERQLTARSSDYVRFIILSGPRTGSHMLAEALNSSPRIRCFREVFNGRLDFIQFGVEGYDDFSSLDMARRKADPLRFLHERIFCRQPEEMRAVGFKYHYKHVWGFAGVIDELVADKELRVLHLRRRNLLRMFVSLRLAEKTGIWLEAETKVTQANLLKAFRHPLKALGRVRRNLQRPNRSMDRPGARVTITPDELLKFSVETHLTAKQFDKLLVEHQVLPVFYEDLLDRQEEVLDEAQSFLGVEPGPLTITTRRQNPEPLHELIENYDELHAVLKDTPQVSLLD
jgi:hypothetical protein